MEEKIKKNSLVESYFIKEDEYYADNKLSRKIPVITVDNYVELGQITALRFLEWVCQNPGGAVALPTGRTPEFFIKWVEYYLDQWDKEMQSGILKKIGFDPKYRPEMKSLHFFQLDEFFPINPEHERSFIYFVKKYYISKFGFDESRVNLINTYFFSDEQRQILGNIRNLDDIFPDGNIDLGLRTRKATNDADEKKQMVIKLFDQFCNEYEDKIRQLGGIGFFLGGIGPDGHIAFNVRGSSHHSHTRLTNINYETQAAAATDLGGIELVRKKAVITIGLETITFNPDAVAIIIAAGESKSEVIANAAEKDPALEYPATCLHKMKNARFYITKSTLSNLQKSKKSYTHLDQYFPGDQLIEKLMIKGLDQTKRSIPEILHNDKVHIHDNLYFKYAKDISGKKVDKLLEETLDSIHQKIQNGIKQPENQKILHTAPHHDDIELAYFPYLHHLVRSYSNENHFCYCTSGFTAVTNFYVQERLQNILETLMNAELRTTLMESLLKDLSNYQEDITGYLNGIASQNKDKQMYFLTARLARLFLQYLNTIDVERLLNFVEELIDLFQRLEPGRKEPEIAHLIKGWLREFEAELVWAHFGIDTDHVSHLRLHFYSDNIFPEYPNFEMDVKPILQLMKKLKPTIITLALDPEGSGPDTHYKTLIALADAIDHYMKLYPDINLRIWGYRNIWSRFDISDINMIIPVSLNSFAVLHNMFNSCFLSQKSASFPSFEWDGTFSELAQKIWVRQHNHLVKLLGKDYFYSSPNPLLRRSYGAIFIKKMNYKEFRERMVPVRRLLKAKDHLNK